MGTRQRRPTTAVKTGGANGSLVPAPDRDDGMRLARVEAERDRLVREAEQARAAAEADRQRLCDLFMQAPVPVALLRGPEHVVELANPPALRVWGRTGAAVRGKPLPEVLPELQRQGIKELLDGVFTTGRAHRATELKVRLDQEGDGNLEDEYFTFVYEPMRDAAGAVEGVMVVALDVSDQVLARQQVEASEERRAAALAAGFVGTWIWDISGDVLRADEHLARLFGLDPVRAASGLSLASFVAAIHPEDRPRVERAIGVAIARGQPYEAEYRVTGDDNRVRWVVARGHVTYDAYGRPLTFPGALADITERKRVEEELRQKQEQLQIALAASDTGTFRWDPATGAYLTFDANLKRLFGFAPDDPVRVTEDKLARVHPDDVDALRAAIRRRRQCADFEMDYRVVLPDGKVRWLHDRGKMEHDEAGRPAYLVGACTDITRRKQHEAAAREAAERFRFLAESMPQKVFTATPTGDVDYFNPQWTAYTGLAFGQIRDWGWLQIIHPDDREKNIRVWRHSIETGEPFQLEHRFRRADGVYRWHLSRALPMRDAHDRVVKWFGANSDIDDQKRAMQQQEDFISIAAHELKTPVTGVKAYAQVLQRRLQRRGDTQAAAQVAKMDAQLNKLTRLIGELLDVTMIGASRLPLQATPLDVDALVAEVVEEVQQTAERHRIVREGTAGRHVVGDSERIGQVLTNLLTNAIKYSPQADTIIVRTAADAESVTVGVQDFGVGIAKDKQGQLFERFYRVSGPEHAHFPGLGLGLYISAEIVRRHGGRIWVESDEGQGATFWFRLPAPRHSSDVTQMLTREEPPPA